MSLKNLERFLSFGRRCPNCTSIYYEMIKPEKGGMKFTRARIEIWFYCNSCNKQWKETYELVDVSKCKEVVK